MECAEVDSITSNRSPQPRLAAIYLLTPTSQNVHLVLSDFQPGQQQQPASNSKTSGGISGGGSSKKNKEVGSSAQQLQGPKYASAYLHFVDGESGRRRA